MNIGNLVACVLAAMLAAMVCACQCVTLGILKGRAFDPQQTAAAAVVALGWALVIASLVMGPHNCLVNGQLDGNGNCEIDQDDLENLHITDDQLDDYLANLSLSTALLLGGLVAGAVACHAQASKSQKTGYPTGAYAQHAVVCVFVATWVDADVMTQLGGNTAWFQPAAIVLAVWLTAQALLKALAPAPAAQAQGLIVDGYVPQ